MSASRVATEVLFSAVDSRGRLLELRRPHGDELLCGECQCAQADEADDEDDAEDDEDPEDCDEDAGGCAATAAEAAESDSAIGAAADAPAGSGGPGELRSATAAGRMELQLPADLLAELAAIEVEVLADPAAARADSALTDSTAADTAAGDWDDPVVVLFPGSAEPGHDCSDTFTGPVWILTDPACCAPHPRPTWLDEDDDEENGTLATADRCRCGQSDLHEVISELAAVDRQRAFAAHLTAMELMYDHMMTAETFASGEALDEKVAAAALAAVDGRGSAAELSTACLVCLVDPEFHQNEIDEQLAELTLQLATVLRTYRVDFTVGALRAPHTDR
jgi:hypothetical protein